MQSPEHHVMQRNRGPRSSGYRIYVLLTLLMIGTLLAWQAWSRTDDFDRFHRQLATTSAYSAANEIELLFGELRRSMRLFARDRQALLETISADTDNDDLWAELEMAVQEHYPEVFGLTLTDTAGNLMRPDFENRVEEVCQQDIHQFINRGYEEQGVIHPNPLGYHFDIMVPWGAPEAPEGVFFLSFQPEMLSRILQHLQPPGHELLLLNRDKPGLIEVSVQGTRDHLDREFFLTEDERAQFLASVPVADSHWILVDMPVSGLLAREALRNWVYAGIVFSVFAGVTLLMFYQIRRKEKSRIQAEEQALQHQNVLAHVDRLNILGEMASGIAHELNQPLTAISTYCQSGLRIVESLQDRPERLVHAMESASRQAKRAGEIIHRMREFAGKGKSQPVRMDINRVITEATEFIRPELDRQDIRLQLDLADGLPIIMADSIQIEQVILNLMYNAIESMTAVPIGLRRLTISSRLAEAQAIEVRVTDTGHGLDPDNRDSIFDTFFTTRVDGMGLGLAISRSIIEAHGGQLGVDANSGPGATFRFRLPLNGAL